MPTQDAVRRWFDHTYGTLGLEYLRPPEFYRIFPAILGARPGERLLDVGCGPGLLLGEARREGIEAAGVDVSLTALAMVAGNGGAGAVACNSQLLPFPDETFDHLTCIGVLEHFLDPLAALAEMRRVTRRSGRLCLMVPNSVSLKWLVDHHLLARHEEDSHERAESFGAWRGLFTEARLTIERVLRDEWPMFHLRRRLGRRGLDGFERCAGRRFHLLPRRLASQFVFVLRP